MDSSGSLERISRLRFALQTPSSTRRPPGEPYDDDLAESPERSERSERSDRAGRGESGAAIARREREARAESASLGEQIILLLEEDPAVVAAVAKCLHEAGYKTLCAMDVEDAVQKVASLQVALVLLNWGLLRRIGGSELIARLRLSSPRARLPMVVISDDVSALNEASSLGIEDYLLDPLKLEDLVHVVDEHCC